MQDGCACAATGSQLLGDSMQCDISVISDAAVSVYTEAGASCLPPGFGHPTSDNSALHDAWQFLVPTQLPSHTYKDCCFCCCCWWWYLCMLLANCWLQGCFPVVQGPLGMLQQQKHAVERCSTVECWCKSGRANALLPMPVTTSSADAFWAC
jgi:hypothetical protein